MFERFGFCAVLWQALIYKINLRVEVKASRQNKCRTFIEPSEQNVVQENSSAVLQISLVVVWKWNSKHI